MPDTALIALVLATYLAAGIVKGVVGLGLPTVTLVVLVPSVGLAPAVALTVVPTIVTNIAQAFSGGHLVAILRRLWPLVVAAVVGLVGVVALSLLVVFATALGAVGGALGQRIDRSPV